MKHKEILNHYAMNKYNMVSQLHLQKKKKKTQENIEKDQMCGYQRQGMAGEESG